MTALLNPGVADKLAKVCGMFGSNQDGERAAAALMADRLIREYGLSWSDVFNPRRLHPPEPESLPELIGWMLAHPETLNPWEMDFIRTLHAPISPKQRDKLNSIAAKVRAYVTNKDSGV